MDKGSRLAGEEQSLSLGRQFLQLFGQVVFNLNDRSITLGRARIEIEEEVFGGNPLDRARSVKLMSGQEERVVKTLDTDIELEQRDRFETVLNEFDDVFNDKPGRTPECEHVIDTGNPAPIKSRPSGIRLVGRKKLINNLMRCWTRGCAVTPTHRGPAMWY